MSLIQLECPNCKSLFEKKQVDINRKVKKGHRVFCSFDCSVEMRKKESRLTVTCLHCAKEFVRRKFEVGDKVFCSSSCAASHNNKITKPKGEEAIHSYRKIAIDFYGNSCVLCGFNRDYGIEVHHIDKNRVNAKLTNLVVLCANCHCGVHSNSEKVKELEEYIVNRSIV